MDNNHRPERVKPALLASLDRLGLDTVVIDHHQADEELPEPWALWLDLWAQALRRPEVARVRAEFDARWRATIAAIVVEGEEAGDVFGAGLGL